MLRNIQNGKEFSDEMRENNEKTKVLLHKELPEFVEQQAQKIVDESFQKETYQDGQSTHWKERKNDNESAKQRQERRALLVKSSKLIRSVEAERRGDEIIIGSDAEYAQVHNEGLKAGKGKGFNMPKRQFMPIPGESNPLLDKRVEKFLDDAMDKIWG
jgi:phage gpG-like protein